MAKKAAKKASPKRAPGSSWTKPKAAKKAAAKKRPGHPPGSVGAAFPKLEKTKPGKTASGGKKFSFWLLPAHVEFLAKCDPEGGSFRTGFRRLVQWAQESGALNSVKSPAKTVAKK